MEGGTKQPSDGPPQPENDFSNISTGRGVLTMRGPSAAFPSVMNQEDSQRCCSQEQDYTSDTVLNAGFSATPKKGSYWRRMGGGSLMVSLVIHALLVIIAIFVIHTITVIRIVEPEHKFLSGGGGGGKSTVEKAGANRRQMSVRQPLSRIVSSGGNSEITLPPMQSINRNLTMSGVALMSGGGMGGGEGGLRGKGAGGAFGDSFGKGFGPCLARRSRRRSSP
jgi:hypothetical protein